MINNNSAFKYETPYKGPLQITQYWTNDTLTPQCSAKQIRYDIHCIKPFMSDTKVEDIISENDV